MTKELPVSGFALSYSLREATEEECRDNTGVDYEVFFEDESGVKISTEKAASILNETGVTITATDNGDRYGPVTYPVSVGEIFDAMDNLYLIESLDSFLYIPSPDSTLKALAEFLAD